MKPYGHGHTRMCHCSGKKKDFRELYVKVTLREARLLTRLSRRMGRLVGKQQILNYLNGKD